jgi:hypothetical protein
MNYRAIRAQLSARGQFPFVNSAYGDNHDQVVIPPLSRSEFVAAASTAGISEQRAQALFAEAGGPDTVHAAVIRAENERAEDVVDRAARILGDSLESFFDVAIGADPIGRGELRLRVATGQLQPAQLAYLRHLELSEFLLKKDKRGRTIVSSPIIGRLLLTRKDGPWIAYTKVLEAIDDDRFGEAARQIGLLDLDSPHLEAFAGLIALLAAVHDSDRGGLLEIDWNTVRSVGRQLLTSDLPVDPHRAWIDQLVRWSDRVRGAVSAGQGRGARLDVLMQHATDPDVRNLLQYALRVFLRRVRRSGSPAEQVRAAGSIPESILQALSAYLGLDPLNAPDVLPDLGYQKFFGNLGDYRPPAAGSSLDLTHLLVIVPALLENRCVDLRDQLRLCDARFVKPLHQRLVAQTRNATAHTYAEMDDATSAFFFSTCETLLEDAITAWGPDTLDAIVAEPDRQALADLLSGRVGAAGGD